MDLNSVIQYITSGMFYLVTAILALLGAFCIYIYIRYAKSPTIAVVISVLFAFMFLTISGNALRLLVK